MGYDLNLLMIEIHIFNQLVGKSYMYIICIYPTLPQCPGPSYVMLDYIYYIFLFWILIIICIFLIIPLS